MLYGVHDVMFGGKTPPHLLHITFVSADHRIWFQSNSMHLLFWWDETKFFFWNTFQIVCWWLIVDLETLWCQNLSPTVILGDTVACLSILVGVPGGRIHTYNLSGCFLYRSGWFKLHNYCPSNGYGDFQACNYFYSLSLISDCPLFGKWLREFGLRITSCLLKWNRKAWMVLVERCLYSPDHHSHVCL